MGDRGGARWRRTPHTPARPRRRPRPRPTNFPPPAGSASGRAARAREPDEDRVDHRLLERRPRLLARTAARAGAGRGGPQAVARWWAASARAGAPLAGPYQASGARRQWLPQRRPQVVAAVGARARAGCRETRDEYGNRQGGYAHPFGGERKAASHYVRCP